MSENFDLPTQFELNKLEIDGNDVIGLFRAISIYENISIPLITGSMVLLESDNVQFLSKYEIEGSEDVKIEATNAKGETLTFEGVLNGLNDKVVDGWNASYVFNFSAKELRKNEQTAIVKRFDNKDPQQIVEEMLEKIEGQTDKVEATGKPMSFTGVGKSPTDIIKYVLTHGVGTKGSPTASSGKQREGETKGTTGFLCWQTLKGYRFASVDDVLSGQAGEEQPEFTHRFQNHSLSMDEGMSSILKYDFNQIGDIQTKMRAGAFKNKNISFDMDSGQYIEYTYTDDKNMTEKQKQIALDIPTKTFWKPFSNEVFEKSCQPAQENAHDQSREYLAQNAVRQNTFTDQSGSFTLPPRFEINAGDTIEIKIPRVESTEGAGYNEKHSGRYVIKQVGHHLFSDGRSYTKIKTIRSTIQQDDATSRQS